MMTSGMQMVKSKSVGDFKINMLQVSSRPDTMAITFWSQRLGKEIYNTGKMQKTKAMMMYNNMNSEPKVKSFLKQKVRLTPSMLRMNW